MDTKAIESTSAKAVIPEEDQPNRVVDIRTKPEEGAGENAETEDQKAAAETARLETEKNTRKETALAAGKTEAEFEAEELNAGKTEAQITEEKKLADEKTAHETEVAKLLADDRIKFLKSMGVETEDELREKLNPKKPKTDEEIARDKEIYSANLASFAVKNKILNNEEWLAVHNMRNAGDNELVYQDFAKNYKEVNKGRLNDDKEADPVTEDEVKDKFNELYHAESTNASLKEQGEKNIALKAKSIREPLETKYNDAKLIYDDEAVQQAAVPVFKKMFQQVIYASIPDHLEFGEGDNKVNVPLDTLKKEELEQHFIKEIGDREFTDFVKGKGTPAQRERIAKEVEKEILYRFKDDIAKKAWDNGVSHGTKTSATGSDTRFVAPGKETIQKQGVKVSAEDNAKIAAALR